jgi:RNA recognition motif-containing protein
VWVNSKGDNSQESKYLNITWVSNLITNNFSIAYIEFANKESAIKAKRIDETLFKGRQLTVMPKRKNKPGFSRGGMGYGSRGANNPMAFMLQLMRGMTRGI